MLTLTLTVDDMPPRFDPRSRIWAVVRHGLCGAAGAGLVVAGWMAVTLPPVFFFALTDEDPPTAEDQASYDVYFTATAVVFLAATLGGPLLAIVGAWLERRAMRVSVFWIVTAVAVPIFALATIVLGVVLEYILTATQNVRIAIGVMAATSLVFVVYWLLLWLVNVVSYVARRAAYALRRRSRLMSAEVGEPPLTFLYRSGRWTIARHALAVGASGAVPGAALLAIFTPLAALLALAGSGADPASSSFTADILLPMAQVVAIVTAVGLAGGAIVAVPAWSLERLVRRGGTVRIIVAVAAPVVLPVLALALLVGGASATEHAGDTFAEGLGVVLLASVSFAGYWPMLWLLHLCHLGIRYRRLRRRWRKLRRVEPPARLRTPLDGAADNYLSSTVEQPYQLVQGGE